MVRRLTRDQLYVNDREQLEERTKNLKKITKNPPTPLKLLALAGIALSLSACGGGMEITSDGTIRLPITTVTKTPAEDYALLGYIYPNSDYSSEVKMARLNSDVTCAGQTSSSGNGVMNCSDGLEVSLQIPVDKYGTSTGHYVQTIQGIKTAVGWGNDSNLEFVSGLLK